MIIIATGRRDRAEARRRAGGVLVGAAGSE
jgi:hypothetical protein